MIDQDSSKKRVWKTHPGRKGVIYREHPTRKHGKKPDRFWGILHRVNGKQLWETLGWSSDGWTADMAQNLYLEFEKNVKLGEHPQSLKEKREMSAVSRAEEARRASLEGLKRISFGELAEYYREWVKANRRSGAFVCGMLDRHVLPELGGMCAADMTPADINAFRERLEKKHPASGRGMCDPNATLSPQTVLHALKTVREVFNFALETPHPELREMLFSGKNPAVLSRRGRGVRAPQFDARRLRILKDPEIEAILSYECENPAFTTDLHDMILLSLDTGVRVGELIRIRCEDIYPDTGEVRVFSGSDSGLTKGGRTRIVHAGHLFPESLDMLRRRIASSGDSAFLFPGRSGGMRESTAVSRSMKRIAASLGLNDGVSDTRNQVVWHTLRHTFATRMLESGVDIYTLKELLGHSSVSVTEGYLHLCDRAKREKSLARIALGRGITVQGR